ncbi:restriction endonuclease [Streptacidiphilus sp. EB103A]|uniref:restriction endonuclease n=1 Tax=Streptacidiphilus sp. EB103A TaxID=3156275 RepID=UPI003513878A
MSGSTERGWETIAKWILILATGDAVVEDFSGWANRHLWITIPVLFAVGVLAVLAGPRLLARWRNRPLPHQQSTAPAASAPPKVATFSLADLDAVTWRRFELVVCELLERDGFLDVQHVGGASDDGVDAVAWTPDGRKVAFQCKKWVSEIGPNYVRELKGSAQPLYDADVAVLVAINGCTPSAVDTARRVKVHLVQRDALARWAAGEPLRVLLPVLTPREPVPVTVSA